jgi:HSP20 family protein
LSFAAFNDPFDIFFTSHTDREPQFSVGHNTRGIILSVALPGRSRSDIDVEVNAGRLTLTAKAVKPAPGYNYATAGIFLGGYTRTWSLPKTANPEGIEASYDAGIITVTIPHAQNTVETVRKIEVL